MSHKNKKSAGDALPGIHYRGKLFEVLANRSTDIYVVFSPNGYMVEYVSSNIERLLGIPVEAVKEDLSCLKPAAESPEDEISAQMLSSMKPGEVRKTSHERVHPVTGEKFWYRETVFRTNIDGKAKFLLVMSDRTQELRVQQQLEQTLEIAKGANEGKSVFLANMSHDIRTPMNIIIGFSHLLEQESNDPAKVREYTRKITAASKHLLSLINDILDMSKFETGKTAFNITEFDLSEFLDEVRDIVQPQARAKNLSFEMRLRGLHTESLIGDKMRIQQILLNILSNAVKYTPEGGTIEFTISHLKRNSRRFSHLQFKVKDTGIGISPEHLETIFEPFTREKNSTASGIPGTGLGLAITKNLVDLMGGTIDVQSRQGVGTTFTVELDLQVRTQEADAAFWKELGITRILSVDDEIEICRDIEMAMAATGVEVHSAHSGEAAIEMVRQKWRAGTPYDLILLDWKMPVMDGLETAQRIRQEVGNQVPILILTAYDWDGVEEAALDAGISAFLPKPFFETNFRQTVQRLGSQPAEENAEEYTLSGFRFLAVEDNELNAEILCELLNMEGAQCDLAVNGKLGLDMFLASEPGYYDMILMDIQMPVMDGYTAAREIRASAHPDAKNILIAAMTANAFAEDVQDALNAGMDTHIAKPLDMDRLKIELLRLLKRS